MREISAVIFQGKPRCGAFFNEETWHMDFFFLPEAVTFEEGHVVTFEEGHVVAAGRLLSEPTQGSVRPACLRKRRRQSIVVRNGGTARITHRFQ